MAAVQVIVIAAKRGDFHLVENIAHQHHAEMRADAPGARKQVHDAVGPGVGGYVEIFRFHAQQQVAHTTTHQIRLVARAAQLRDHLMGERLGFHIPMLICVGSRSWSTGILGSASSEQFGMAARANKHQLFVGQLVKQ